MAGDQDGVLPTRRAMTKMAEATRRVLKRGQSPAGPDLATRFRAGFLEGELTENLDAPDPDGLTGATTATAKRWVPVIGSTTDPVEMELSDEEYTLVNRSPSLGGSSGTYVIWHRIGNEWRVLWMDC